MERNVLILCSANKGRSASIEGYGNFFADAYGLDINISSAAVNENAFNNAAEQGFYGASRKAVKRFENEGIGGYIKGHRSRMVDQCMLDGADIVFSVDAENIERVKEKYNISDKRIFTIKDFLGGFGGHDIIDAHQIKGKEPEEYGHGYMKGSHEANEFMYTECAYIAEKLISKIHDRDW